MRWAWAGLGAVLLGVVALWLIVAALFGVPSESVSGVEPTPTANIAAPAKQTPSPIVASANVRQTPAAARPMSKAATGTGQLIWAEVVRVIEGDTLEVRIGSMEAQVRMIGVDAPDLPTCFAQEALARAEEMVEEADRWVLLEVDKSYADAEGRLLRYVWAQLEAGRRMLNEELVKGGFARAVAAPPDTRHQDRLFTLEHEARVEKLGLWGVCPELGAPAYTPTATAHPTAPPTSTPTTPPTLIPTAHPTSKPTNAPTLTPTLPPTALAATPTHTPASTPTQLPTRTATRTRIASPTATGKPPTSTAALTPSPQPAPVEPTLSPTQAPPAPEVATATHAQPSATTTTSSATSAPTEQPTPTVGLRYDPNGPDRDCADFETQEEAQAFYIAAGGPERDPHRLDADRDGIACEHLPKSKR